METLPLINCADLSRPFVCVAERTVTAREWLAEVHALAEVLPQRRYLLNYCEDRYRFSVAFAAALLRGQTNLLPPSRAPEVLRRLREEYADVSLLVEPGDSAQIPGAIVFPHLEAEPAAVAGIPEIALDHVAAILFTSGSTGLPAPYAKPWGPLAQGAIGEALRLELPAHA